MTRDRIIISGRVIHGAHYGRKLGFPTANLDRRDYTRRKLNIRFGIYAGRACVGNGRDRSLQGQRTHPAAIVLGPIDNRGLPKIEAHLLNFTGNLYGKKITLSLKKFIRPFRKFSTVDNLKLQIRKDLEVINKLQQ